MIDYWWRIVFDGYVWLSSVIKMILLQFVHHTMILGISKFLYLLFCDLELADYHWYDPQYILRYISDPESEWLTGIFGLRLGCVFNG